MGSCSLATVIPVPACGVHAEAPWGEGLGWHVGSFLGSRMTSVPEEALPSLGFGEDLSVPPARGWRVQEAFWVGPGEEPHGLRAI